ncbi:hypothetical protein GW17_00001755 [Ensete ventricosum]|nr:hypothetical protein GW17_00001755 [Ensete ventricosum]
MDGHFSSAIVPPATTLEATKVAAWAVSARRFQWRNRSGDVIDDVSMPTCIKLVDTHPSKAGSEALELVSSAGEAVCILRPAKQQRLGAVVGGRFHDDTPSRN